DAAVTDLAHGKRDGSNGDFLVGRGMAVIEPKRHVEQQHVETEKAENRPGSHQQECDAGDEADAAENRHQDDEADLAKRAVRRDRRRKDRRFKPAVVGVHKGHYTRNMAKKSVRKSSSKPKARQSRRKAKVKPAPQRAKADVKAALGALRQLTAAEIDEVFRRFQKANPAPKTELKHINPFTLLVAVVLSAQATDAGVNKATPALFALADTPEKMAALGETRVRDLVKTIGLYRTKAKNVVELSRRLVAEHGGEVPRTREALEALPGVGRKTANVVLNVAFGEPTIAVDTHIFRVGNRTGLAPG